METKLNITEILKDKPQGTKLHSPLFGKCTFLRIDDPLIEVLHHADNVSTFYSDGAYFNCAESEPLLFPSKSMQDWSKFAWKKGDVLVSNYGTVEVIFDCFNDDTYASFKGKHVLHTVEEESEYMGNSDDYGVFYTKNYHKESEGTAQTYINTIEERFEGKLNLETLEIEANVNVGDVVSDDVLYGICTKVDNSNVYCNFGCDASKSNAPITNLCLKKENIHVVMSINKEVWYKEIEKKHHISIDRNTLEVQLEFKDGDILFSYNTASIFIFSGFGEYKGFNYYVALHHRDLVFSTGSAWCCQGAQIRYATAEEKQQLFDALAKENKAWDAEKKQIVDLKPKVEFKPFDKVIVRCSEADKWSIDFFSYKTSNRYICTGDSWFAYCLPYNEETAKLIGTKNNVEG